MSSSQVQPDARPASGAAVAPRRYLVQTFGCQMNVHDSRRIEEVLGAAGYTPTDDAEVADLIVVNTCSVREKAEHKLMSLLGKLNPAYGAPDRRIVVAGCVAQQEGEALLKKAPHIDLVLGPDNIPELPQLLEQAEAGAPPRARTVFDDEDPRFLRARPKGGAEVTSFVTVMKGCDERCTFCIVPTTRGSERYRPADDIVGEIAQMVEGGVREVTLLGQTVNSWFDPSTVDENKPRSKRAPSRSEFADLLRRIAREVPDLARLRYTSPHPRHLSPELIDAHAELELLPKHLHLPVQSGADSMLRRMSRRYTRQEYLDRVRALQERVPGLTLSTDLIVGFPGETDEEFEATLSLVREAGFVAAFCFKYSPRPSTPALAMGDDIPEAVKSERLQRLFDVLAVQQRAHLDALVGQRAKVLVEGPNDASVSRYTGRSERHEIIHLEAPEGVDPTGQIVEVEIVRSFKHSLLGRMAGATIPEKPTPRPRRKLTVLSEGA
ncbi:MAG: tRNA (N6-isopentenyl adenosine(37)-C2)-methylthiotransferase MiaB [Deltaproteobacteria bacterium]|nr:tRNA (N6-isopentenyl adenosine(37)-C2)-methylthiotransferase MiaB [Deltaproteobacteria bacterium]